MCNKLKNFLLLAIVSIAVVSCTSEDMNSGKGTLLVNATLEDFTAGGMNTRTTDSGYQTSFSLNDKIGVFAVTSGGSVSDNCKNVCLTYDGSSWSGNTITNIDGAKYFAYYPYSTSINVSSPSGILDVWSPTTDQSTHEKYSNNDLMATESVSASNNTLNFSFKHQMSMLEVILPEQYASKASFAVDGESVSMWNISGNTFRFLTKKTGTTEIHGSFSVGDKTVSFTKDDLYLTKGSYYKLRVDYNAEAETVVVLDITGFEDDNNLDKNDYYLTVSPTDLSFEASSGQKSVTISSNDSWTTSSDATWINVSNSAGDANSRIISVTENTTSSERYGKVTVKGSNSGKTATINVSQKAGGKNDINTEGFDNDKNIDGQETTLSLSKSSCSFGSSANSTNFSVTSNQGWTVSSNSSSWCTVSPTSGNNNGSFTISVTNNTTTSSRSASITVTGTKSGKTATVSVTQDAGGSTDINTGDFNNDTNIDK